MAALTSPLLSLASGSFPDGDSTVTDGFFRRSLFVIVGIIFDIEWCQTGPIHALLNMQLECLLRQESPFSALLVSARKLSTCRYIESVLFEGFNIRCLMPRQYIDNGNGAHSISSLCRRASPLT